ncbi:MAG: 30S ribosomal protein S15 [Verrucomicrobia bacterium CG_4_10_14_3_um_filter_43_23]|nr:MAG: 30S ribosomal protein S15 [Verrucomicrobia bacterium CG22_combo_CG10-13_8_21_14_all_43_17]PIX58545.1 MAG: 30S ribosomal protein S15 [Verrucomicrobia bacterium CG_4_10_14_3_um_filter_43_23]PIY61553.1 MAG: 30S ribosomal protein S15 [Verrucomicrobia bacterium CG_4_10_14_0_8_um_filter_43_34]PJA44809.1 MAG: 30S ribosomal protein S15 [Verrucomicrobia bacterium CG_4_9_14_3_um_filter_43_20]
MDKQQIIEDFKINPKDTGSSEVQIALVTARIKHLTGHLKLHPKDFHSRKGLIALTNLRRKHLNYLKKKDLEKYNDMLQRLSLRR